MLAVLVAMEVSATKIYQIQKESEHGLGPWPFACSTVQHIFLVRGIVRGHRLPAVLYICCCATICLDTYMTRGQSGSPTAAESQTINRGQTQTCR